MRIPLVITYKLGSPVRNFFMGAGLCYSLDQKKPWHIPVVLVAPTVYAGYQMYKQRDPIAQWFV